MPLPPPGKGGPTEPPTRPRRASRLGPVGPAPGQTGFQRSNVAILGGPWGRVARVVDGNVGAVPRIRSAISPSGAGPAGDTTPPIESAFAAFGLDHLAQGNG